MAERNNVHVLATKALVTVLRGRRLEHALERHRNSALYSQISFICFETLRHYYSLSERLQSILRRDVAQLDEDIWCLLLVGACQMQYSSLPKAKIGNDIVDTAKKIGKTSAKGLINAVLRKYDPSKATCSEEARYEMPQWMIDATRTQYGSQLLASIAQASMARAPMSLRVNTSVTEFDAFLENLRSHAIDYELPGLTNAVFLRKPQPAATIPGHAEKHCAVQDISSQLAVPLLDVQDGDRVLDACAAPGIKTCQLRDRHPNSCVDPVDIAARTVACEPSKYSLAADIRKGDLTTTDWWDGNPYQRILLDVPCSSSGTIRRRPDIKVTRSKLDVQTAAKRQAALLENTWQTLDVHGTLVYSTCSIFAEENQNIVDNFVRNRQDVKVDRIELKDGLADRHGVQILPGTSNGDGFYFARLHKVG